MSDVTTVLDPVKTDGLKWPVKELNWRDGMTFLGMIGKHAGEIIGGDGKTVTIDFEKLPALIGNVGVLADFLLTKSTGKSAEEVGELTVNEALTLLDAAIELNLSEELLQRGKSVAGRVGAAFGVKKSKAPEILATPLTS